jgi:hypothetical protein
MLKQEVNKTTLAIVVPEAEEIIGASHLKYAPSAAEVCQLTSQFWQPYVDDKKEGNSP